MNLSYLLFVVLGFLAVVLALDGLYHTFFAGTSKEARRISKRLALLDEHTLPRELHLVRQEQQARWTMLERWLADRGWGRKLIHYVNQAGTESHTSDLLAMSAVLWLACVLLAVMAQRPAAFGAFIGVALAALPWWWVSHRRDQRIRLMERQFPEALDMMSRAMRAGHALTTAIKMCGDELPAPLGSEMRQLSDEVTLGIPFLDALQGLIDRVPLRDVSFLAVALTVQRETGGNLAELLDQISALMRERFKLLGEVRTKSAEGRLSAWILSLLPFGMAGLIAILSPDVLALLWTDPDGRSWLFRLIGLMAFGVFWMSRIVRIRV